MLVVWKLSNQLENQDPKDWVSGVSVDGLGVKHESVANDFLLRCKNQARQRFA